MWGVMSTAVPAARGNQLVMRVTPNTPIWTYVSLDGVVSRGVYVGR